MDTARQIIIGADIVPTESNIKLFCKGNVNRIIGEKLCKIFENDSFIICNLETPLCNCKLPIAKVGPNFAAPRNSVHGLKKMGISLVSLANNHINDQENGGIIETCSTLDREGIHYIGVGTTNKQSAEAFYFDYCGKRIGVYSCVEHEFSTAIDENSYGANTFDPLVSLDQVEMISSECDFVIVLYHGGKEYYRYPSPGLQKICHKLVEKGANLVICQHSHCIGCRENYRNSEIVYGQGNFIFNKKSDEFWDTSLLVRLNSSLNIDYIPIKRTNTGTRLAEGEEAINILKQFNKRSQSIKKEGFIEEEYSKFAKSYLNSYLTVFNGKKPKLFYFANKLLGSFLEKTITKLFYPDTQMLKLKNYIECESHRELLLKGINDAIYKAKRDRNNK